MGKIHLQVEQGRILTQKMNRAAGELFDSASMLKNQVSRLSGAWTGGGAEDFVRRARRCTNALENYADQFEQLGVSLGREIDQWVTADSDGVGRVGSSHLGPMIGTGARSGGGASIASGIGISVGASIYGGISSGVTPGSPWSGENGFQWEKWGLDVIDSADGAFDLFDIPVLFDFATGLMEGESFKKALLSGGISAAITGGIAGIVIGTNPVGFTVLAVNSAFQLGGNIAEGAFRVFGNESAAESIDYCFDKVDLGGYVEKFSDAVADFVMNGEVRAGVKADIEATLGKYSCGIRTQREFGFGWSW